MLWRKLTFIFLLLFAQNGFGKPTEIELGAGLIGQYGPDYRGSSKKDVQGLPIPYIRYDSERITLDRKGIDGRLFVSEYFRLNLSADGSLNGRSDDNPLREGMPELHSALELGPSFDIKLFGESFDDGISLRLPLRAVFTIDPSHTAQRGYVFNPRITWKTPNFAGGIRSSLNAGLLYGSSEYHEYYYAVAPQFVSPSRSLYNTEAGYSGEYIRWTFYKKIGLWRFAASMRYDNVSRANFSDSPLVDANYSFGFGLAIIKVLWQNNVARDKK